MGGNNCSRHRNSRVCWLPQLCFPRLWNRNWSDIFKHVTSHTLWNCERARVTFHYCRFSSSISSPPLLSSLPLSLPFRLSSTCLCSNSWFSLPASFLTSSPPPVIPDCFPTFPSECQRAGVCGEWGAFLRTVISEAYVLESLWNPPGLRAFKLFQSIFALSFMLLKFHIQ